MGKRETKAWGKEGRRHGEERDRDVRKRGTEAWGREGRRHGEEGDGGMGKRKGSGSSEGGGSIGVHAYS